MKNIRYLLAIVIVPLLLTGCGNNPGDNSGEDIIDDNIRTIIFDSEHNVLNLNYDNQGKHICVDDLGNEITFTTFSNYGIAVDVSGDFLYFTNSHENSTGLIRFSFNLENIHSYKISYPGEDFVSILPQITFDSSSGSKYVTSFEEVSEDSSIKDLVMDFNIEHHYGFYLNSIVITYLDESDTVEDVPHVLRFYPDAILIPTTTGAFTCYDDKGWEVTGRCTIPSEMYVLIDNKFSFHSSVGYYIDLNYSFHLNISHIGKVKFDCNPFDQVYDVSYSIDGPDYNFAGFDNFEDPNHQGCNFSFDATLQAPVQYPPELRGFEITYYPEAE